MKGFIANVSNSSICLRDLDFRTNSPDEKLLSLIRRNFLRGIKIKKE